MTNDDAISRSDAIRVASGYCHWSNIPKELAKLPSVNPIPCNDAISRQAAIGIIQSWLGSDTGYSWGEKNVMLCTIDQLRELPSVNTEKTGHCKDCKYFEYDSVAKVDGIPLIVAHEICSKWGDGCKTREDGYCFLFEPQESETWNGYHGQITAPKGTFERIFNDADDSDI